MIGGPFARSAFTFVAVVTRQVVSRRSAAGQVRLVLRAVESRTLDLVSRSRGGRGEGRVVGSRNQSYRWHRWVSKNFKALLPSLPRCTIITAHLPPSTRAHLLSARPYLFQFVGYARPVIAIKSRDIRDSISFRSPAVYRDRRISDGTSG